MINNISIQKEFGWCMVHTLCNVLRDHDFKDYIGDEEFKAGDIDAVNKLLHRAGYRNIKMRKLISIPDIYPSLPVDYVNSIICCENDSLKSENIDTPVIAYFLTVQLFFSESFHYVSIIKKGDVYLYSDPYRNRMIKLKSISDVWNYFESCIAIERLFNQVGEEEKWSLIDPDCLTDYLTI